MARTNFIVDTTDTALSVGSWTTVLQLSTPTNLRVKILQWGISFQGVTSTNTPITVQLYEQSDSLGMVAATAIGVDRGLGVTSASSAFKSAGTATEPTDIGNPPISVVNVHPQSSYQKTMPFGQEIIQSGSTIIGIRVFAAQANNASAYIIWEE